MIANITPIHLAHNKPDIVFDLSGRSAWNCYDTVKITNFFNPLTGYLNQREIFEWNSWLISSNFWDIIKDKVHIFPSLYVDFGLVLSQKEIPYYIWNSYSDRSVYIQDPTVVGDYGTTFVIDIAGNFTLQPGKGVPATLTVYVEGPISSGTDFHIIATPSGLSAIDFVLKTIATRVIVFPLWADWSKKVKFGVRFRTVISKSTQNLEQRRPLMEKPQRFVSFTNVDTNRGLLTNAINFAQDKSVGIPIIHEMFQAVSIDSNKMGITILEKTTELWNLKRFCNYILLFDVTSKVLVAKKVTSLAENKIYIENPILEELPNISSVVGFPMIIGVFKSAKPSVLNGNYISWDLLMEELIGENQPALSGVPPLPLELLKKFDWSDKVELEQPIYRDIGEFPGTAQMIYSKHPLNRNTNKAYSGSFTFKSREELFTFMDFICGTKGRFKKFEYLVPMNEFQLVRPEYEGVNQVRVKNNFYAEQFSKVLNKKVVLKYRNNSLSTTISSIETNSQYTTITFTNPTNFRIYEEDMNNARIEQYKTVRMDLDEFTINCNSGKSFSLNVRMMEVYE